MPLNQRARKLPRSVVGRVGPGAAQLGVSRRGRPFVVCASRSVWCKKNTGRRLCIVLFSRESPPRTYPDRRLGWCDGVRRAASLRSLRFHFGHSRLAPGGCRVAPKKKKCFFLTYDCGFASVSFLLVVPLFPFQPGFAGRSPGSTRGLGFFVKFALPPAPSKATLAPTGRPPHKNIPTHRNP